MKPDQRTYAAPVELENHPAPWWYRVLSRIFPSSGETDPAKIPWWDRCREIPEARNPECVLLRQFAIIRRYVYLQQFASSEDPRYQHSHPWHFMIAIGLWGRYRERRMAGPDRERKAPYCYTMDASHIHQVQNPAPGHTSIFIGLWRDDDMKHYYRTPTLVTGTEASPVTVKVHWTDHIKKMVKRI